MMTLLDIINQNEYNNIMGTVEELKSKYRNLNKIINKFLQLRKDDLLTCLKNIRTYKHNYDKIKIILDDEQRAIVKANPNMHIRIIAGAGSGKTTTILYRIKHLLETTTTPDKLLILTFNVDACNSLKKRIKDIFGFDLKIDIRTIDSLCASLYRGYYSQVPSASNKNIDLISLNEYQIYAEEVMKCFGHIICAKYQYVFFDEFQDINDIQFNILKTYADNGCYLTVIGDDNQNIYQWRGSNNRFIIGLESFIPNLKTMKITSNYRSTDLIVELANNSIINNKNRIDKIMVAHRKLDVSEHKKYRPKLILCERREEQFEFIVRKINYLIQDRNYKYDDIAILSRNTYYLKLFEEFISKNNKYNRTKIPYIALISDDDAYSKPIISPNNITISTIHKSKGLEWGAVFMLGLCDEQFPCLMNNNIINIEEERRLFYVGVTRAKEYLHFVANSDEIPLSRFIDEIYDNVKFISKIKKREYMRDKLFDYTNISKTKDMYSVTDTIKLLKPQHYKELREFGLIPNISPIETVLYNEELCFSDEIKKNYYEADFGEFCDRIITRSFMKTSTDLIQDPQTEIILNTVFLEKKEMELSNKYKIGNLMLKNPDIDIVKNIVLSKVSMKKDKSTIDNIFKKIKRTMQTHDYQVRKILMRDNTYPKKFMDELEKSYAQYCNKDSATSDILNYVYKISLCGHFNNNRRRLLYKDIFPLFTKDFDKVDTRINDYVKIMEGKQIKCKISVMSKLQIKNDEIPLVGEIDMINVTDNVLIDFKFAESDYKLEWFLQILTYYVMLKESHPDRYNITKLGIVNLLKGKYYEIDIPEDYPTAEFLNYIKNVIICDRENIRPNNSTDKQDLLYIDEKIDTDVKMREIEPVKQFQYNDNVFKHDLYMVFDTETTGANVMIDNVIQLAYLIFDSNLCVVKKVNAYIKPQTQMISADALRVHKISQSFLEENGGIFHDIMQEFLYDVGTVKYVIGHNVKFDIEIVKNSLSRSQFNVDIFKTKIVECTGNMGKRYNFVNAMGKQKMPKLTELYKKIFGHEMENAHDAMADITACAKCYFHMKGIVDKAEMIKKITADIIETYKETMTNLQLTDQNLFDRLRPYHHNTL